MTTIGLIGAGEIGGTLARLAVAAGYDVVLSNSRGPAALAGLIAELGPGAGAAAPAEAAEAGDLVVVAIPFKAYPSVPAGPLAGKVVIDASNYCAGRDGHFAELDSGSVTSSEQLQQHLPASRVVKCFNSIGSGHLGALARRAGSPERSALPVAGDDQEAKAAVTAFAGAIGYDVVDAGPLAEGRRFQPGTALFATVYIAGGRPDPTASGVPAGAEVIGRLLAAAGG